MEISQQSPRQTSPKGGFFNKAITALCRFFRAFLLPLRRNAVFFVFMFVLGALCVVLEADPHPQRPRYPYPLVELTLDLYVLCLLLLLIPRRAKRWVRGTLAVLLYAIAIVDVWCWTHFQSMISPTMLLLIGETNGHEATEFFGSYVSWHLLFTKVGWLLLLCAGHIAVACQHLKLRRWCYSRVVQHIPYRLPLQAVAGAALLGLLIYGGISSWENKQTVWRTMRQTTIGGVERELVRKNTNEVMYLPAYRLAFSVKSNRLIARQLDNLLAAERRATVDSCAYTSPHIVLIIGESFNKHHASLYGYDKPTTPLQQQLAQSGRLTAYNNVVAPWNLTSFVFKLMFSTYTVHADKDDDWCDHPLFPSLFRKAGYRVDFLTNQFLPRSKEAIYDFSGGFFLNDEELSKAMFDHRNTRLHPFDSGLLADYDSLSAVRQNDTVPRLTIFHLMGQHVEYNQRFPTERTFFTPDDYDRPDLKKKEVQWVADYDNATRYNDSIVAQIVRRFDGEDAVIIYLADHGEEVYDGIRNKHGRVHAERISPRLAHEEYEIPFWFYCTRAYIRTHPDLFRRIRRQKDTPFMSDALPHLLLYLAGISTPHYDERCNILSPSYDEKRPRLMKKRTDYNQLDMNHYRK